MFFQLFSQLRVDSKMMVTVGHELREANRVIVKYGNISGCLIDHMNFMSLIHQANERAAHGDDVVVRMR